LIDWLTGIVAVLLLNFVIFDFFFSFINYVW
jgi:hypothetical protein